MPEKPDVSVIICSRNRPSLLLGAVRSVLSGDCVPLEIVVVDQSDVANDASGEISERVQYIPSKTVGAGRARNIGIRSSRGALLAFIDDDVVVHTTWLGILIDALVQLGPCGVVTGKVRDASPGADTFAPSTREDDDSVVFSGSTFKDVLFTGNMALFRSTINVVGYFDERLGPGTAFPAAEDNDFGIAVAAGWLSRAVCSATRRLTTSAGGVEMSICRSSGAMARGRAPIMRNISAFENPASPFDWCATWCVRLYPV